MTAFGNAFISTSGFGCTWTSLSLAWGPRRACDNVKLDVEGKFFLSGFFGSSLYFWLLGLKTVSSTFWLTKAMISVIAHLCLRDFDASILISVCNLDSCNFLFLSISALSLKVYTMTTFESSVSKKKLPHLITDLHRHVWHPVCWHSLFI